jgi:hypothetical protein
MEDRLPDLSEPAAHADRPRRARSDLRRAGLAIRRGRRHPPHQRRTGRAPRSAGAPEGCLRLQLGRRCRLLDDQVAPRRRRRRGRRAAPAAARDAGAAGRIDARGGSSRPAIGRALGHACPCRRPGACRAPRHASAYRPPRRQPRYRQPRYRSPRWRPPR